MCHQPALRSETSEVSTLHWRDLFKKKKQRSHSKNASKVLPSTLHQRNLKMQQLPAILDWCLWKTWAGKSHIIETLLFSKSSVFKMFSVHTKT